MPVKLGVFLAAQINPAAGTSKASHAHGISDAGTALHPAETHPGVVLVLYAIASPRRIDSKDYGQEIRGQEALWLIRSVAGSSVV